MQCQWWVNNHHFCFFSWFHHSCWWGLYIYLLIATLMTSFAILMVAHLSSLLIGFTFLISTSILIAALLLSGISLISLLICSFDYTFSLTVFCQNTHCEIHIHFWNLIAVDDHHENCIIYSRLIRKKSPELQSFYS